MRAYSSSWDVIGGDLLVHLDNSSYLHQASCRTPWPWWWHWGRSLQIWRDQNTLRWPSCGSPSGRCCSPCSRVVPSSLRGERGVRQWTWYQMGRWEKETRGQTGEKLIESSTRSGLVQLYWHPTCLRVRGTSQRGLKPGGYQQLFQCLKVGELEYRWLSFPWRLTWQYGKYGGSSKSYVPGEEGGRSICLFWCWTNVV